MEFARALPADLTATFGRIYVEGEWVSPAGHGRIDVLDSSTEELAYQVAEAAPADMERAVASARRAFDEGPWPRLSHAERAEYLRRMADALRKHAKSIAATWSIESGVVHSYATAVAGYAGYTFDMAAGFADSFEFLQRAESYGNDAFIAYEPVGVAACIIPWNSPIYTMSHKIAPALLAGCTVVLKAAPEAPAHAYIMAEVAREIGLPAGVLAMVTAGRETSEALVRDQRVDKISFTGSTATGRRIAQICGERIARCTLELGGKSAAVILDDYSVAQAAEAIVAEACVLSGQVCAWLSRVIVSRARHDELVDELAERYSRVTVGDAFDPASEMGPLVSEAHLGRVQHMIARGIAEGAQLITGGRRPDHLTRGYFIAPTVFGQVDNDSTVAQQEIFGPVISVVPARDEEHAIRLADETIYGLNASVFTNDKERAMQVARRLRSGTVGHNRYRTDFGVTFGGFKQSGVGREGGREGLLAYLEPKTILLEPQGDN